MEPTAPTPQQAAIQEVRARYERGELSFEAFRRALDALVLAENADECQAVLHALPASPLAPLTALDPPPPTVTLAPIIPPRRKRIVAFMSQAKKLRRPWRLQPSTSAVAIMGEIKLDLNLAELPPHARIHITAIMGTVIIYVPTRVRVAVRSTVVLGEANALGENANGVVAFGHEEHEPAPAPAVPQLEIDVFSLMANVQVKLTDRPAVSIGELVRDALALAAQGVQRGLQQRAASQRALPGEGEYPR
jgi:hypothetical protein